MQRFDLETRTRLFALEVVRLTAPLLMRTETRTLGGQLLRAGTAVGAIYREAGRAESRRDFIHKLNLSLKEADETVYWIELLTGSGLCDLPSFRKLENEARQLLWIFSASVRTARKRAPNR